MIKTLSNKLDALGLTVEIIGPGLLRVSQNNGDMEADVSMAQLLRRLDISDPSTHLRILTAFTQRIASAFGMPQALQIGDIFPRILPTVDDNSLSAPWLFPIAAGLQGALVQDQGVNLRLLPPLELVRLGQPLSNIKASAIDNLKALPCTFEWEKIGLGQAAQHGDGFMSARALVFEKWQNEPCWLGLPSRDELWLWTDPPSANCIAQLKACHEQSPYPISNLFWLWTPENGIQSWIKYA